MYCEYCGKELKNGVKFCSSCGRKVDEESDEKNANKQLVANAFNKEVRIIEKRELKEDKKVEVNKQEKEIKKEYNIQEKNIDEIINKVDEIVKPKNNQEIKREELKGRRRKKKKGGIILKLVVLIIIAALVYLGVIFVMERFGNILPAKEITYSYTTKEGQKIEYNEMEKICVDSVKSLNNMYSAENVKITQIAYNKVEDDEYVYIEYNSSMTKRTNVIKMKNTVKEIDTADLKILNGPTDSLEENAKKLIETQKLVIKLKQEWEAKLNFTFVDKDKINIIVLQK